MIVTCPSCAAKYRVRDEAVPQGGAQLQCPECDTRFLAHPPVDAGEDIGAYVDKLKTTQSATNKRIATMEAQLKEKTEAFDALLKTSTEDKEALHNAEQALAAALSEAARHKIRDGEEISRFKKELKHLQARADEASIHEARLAQLSQELAGERESAKARLSGFEEQLSSQQSKAAENEQHLQQELENQQAELATARSDGQRALQAATEEAQRAIQSARAETQSALLASQASTPEETARLQRSLEAAQKATGRLTIEFEAAKQQILELEGRLSQQQSPTTPPGVDPQVLEHLEAEADRLRQQLAQAVGNGTNAGGDALEANTTQVLLPMLPGLRAAIAYIAPFTSNEVVLTGHLQQLQLLEQMLTQALVIPEG